MVTQGIPYRGEGYPPSVGHVSPKIFSLAAIAGKILVLERQNWCPSRQFLPPSVPLSVTPTRMDNLGKFPLFAKTLDGGIHQ